MTRTTITPSKNNIILPVPEKYIGKKIEVLMFDIEEVVFEPGNAESKLKPSQLRGFYQPKQLMQCCSIFNKAVTNGIPCR